MISKLKGYVDSYGEGYIVIDVNGVGYHVSCSLPCINKASKAEGIISLLIETHSKEGEISLYGFFEEEERRLYRLLVSVQGVGSKIALSLLSIMEINDLAVAISSGDNQSICKANGVGPKLGGRIVSELKGKLSGFTPSVVNTSKNLNEVISALVGLGYKKTEATRVCQTLDFSNKSSEEAIRIALQSINKSA